MSSYQAGADHQYYDEYYWCERCGVACVFSGLEQKEEFEVKKRHVYSMRSLCQACYAKRSEESERA